MLGPPSPKGECRVSGSVSSDVFIEFWDINSKFAIEDVLNNINFSHIEIIATRDNLSYYNDDHLDWRYLSNLIPKKLNKLLIQWIIQQCILYFCLCLLFYNSLLKRHGYK